MYLPVEEAENGNPEKEEPLTGNRKVELSTPGANPWAAVIKK